MSFAAAFDDLLLFSCAVDYAADKHKQQRRKVGDVPYINHPLRVMRLLVDLGGVTDLRLLAAAALHDVVEDTDATIEEVRERFGDVIGGYVAEVTDDRSLPAAERKAAQVEHVKNASRGAQLIKFADKLHNLEDLLHNTPPGWSKERVQGYFVWSEAVLAGARHVQSQRLLDARDTLFESTFTYEGKKVPVMPKCKDKEKFLQAYYESLKK